MTAQTFMSQNEIEGNDVCDCLVRYPDTEIIAQFSRMIIKCLGCGIPMSGPMPLSGKF